MIRNRVPERCRVGALVDAEWSEYGAGDQVRSQRHHHDEPEQWVSALSLVAAAVVTSRVLATKMRAILLAVCDAQRGPVDAVERELAPPIGSGAAMCPLFRRAQEQPFHRLRAQTSTGLRQRT